MVLVMPDVGSAMFSVQAPLSCFSSDWKPLMVCEKVSVPAPFRMSRLAPPPALIAPVMVAPVDQRRMSLPSAKLRLPTRLPWLVKSTAIVP